MLGRLQSGQDGAFWLKSKTLLEVTGWLILVPTCAAFKGWQIQVVTTGHTSGVTQPMVRLPSPFRRGNHLPSDQDQNKHRQSAPRSGKLGSVDPTVERQAKSLRYGGFWGLPWIPGKPTTKQGKTRETRLAAQRAPLEPSAINYTLRAKALQLVSGQNTEHVQVYNTGHQRMYVRLTGLAHSVCISGVRNKTGPQMSVLLRDK